MSEAKSLVSEARPPQELEGPEILFMIQRGFVARLVYFCHPNTNFKMVPKLVFITFRK